MSGQRGVDERELDAWIEEATDGWRLPTSAPATWTGRIAMPGSRWGARSGVRRTAGALGVAAVGMVAVVVLATSWPRGIGVAPGGDAATPASSPTALAIHPPPTGRERDELFELTIASDKARYDENEPITISTRLRYVGAAERVIVTGSGGGLVAFSVEQLDGPVDALAGRDADCSRYEFRQGDVEEIEFQKSASWSSDDPMAAFWRDFVEDPVLRLPAGTYRITAEAEYGPPECGEPDHVAASIEIVVGPSSSAPSPAPTITAAPTTSPAPTGSPVDEAPSDTARDDLFELTLKASRSTWAVDEPIDVAAEFSYIGEAPEVTVYGVLEVVHFDLDQLDGPVDLEPVHAQPCVQHPFRQGDTATLPFQKSGGYDGDDPMADFWRAFFADPELRLPAGRYRISAQADYSLGDCGGDTPPLSVEIEITVE